MNPAEHARLAEAEDRLWYFRSLRERVVQACAREGLPEGAAVLDAGCGTGGLLKRLKTWRGDLRLSGVDYSPAACALARVRSNCEVREAPVEGLPFPTGHFDAIVSTDVLTQIDSPLLAMLEFFRCLKPGGLLVVNSAAMPSLWSYHDKSVQSVRRFRGRELRELVKESGLELRFLTHWNFLLLPLVFLRRKVVPRRSKASDVVLPIAPVNGALAGVAAVERLITRTGVSLPLGSSLFFVARMPMRRHRVLDQ